MFPEEESSIVNVFTLEQGVVVVVVFVVVD